VTLRLFAKSRQSLPDYFLGAAVLPGSQLFVHDPFLLGVKRYRHSDLPSSAMPVPWAAILIALATGASSLSICLFEGAGHFSGASRR
jgi:hypothetical protein